MSPTPSPTPNSGSASASIAQATQNFSLNRPADRRSDPVASAGVTTSVASAKIPTVVDAEAQAALNPLGRDIAATTWIGRQLKQYVVEERLGGGGMGEVFRARHSWLDVPVAIKILHPAYGNDTEAIERFRREAQIAAALNHPNIVRATDGGPVGDSFYIVTELLDGVNLSDLVERHGALPPAYACYLISQVASALEHAHRRGLVHRDIKPSNIMLLRNGSVKLLDLGLARYANSAAELTATGQFMGTIDYMAPEQAIDTSNVDQRADIYSLGCTLYYLIAGKAPFAGDEYNSIVGKILAHAEEVPPVLLYRGKPAPSNVANAVAKMIEKDPDARWQSGLQVINGLASIASRQDHNPYFDNHTASRMPLSNSGNAIDSASPNDDALEQLAQLLNVAFMWILTRIASILGFIEQYEIAVNPRLGTKKTAWRANPKGIAVFVAGTIFLWYFFTYVVIFEAGPPNSQAP